MNPTAAASAKPRVSGWWPAVLLALAIFAAWSNSLSAPFLLDDQESIVANATLRQPSLAWLQPPATAGETVSGRPLLNLSFALDYALHGLDPRGFRATNLLLHATAALLLFGIGRRTRIDRHEPAPGQTGAALALAAIWALHPLQTAAVTYIVQRAEALAGLFVLLTLYSFIRASASAPAKSRWFVLAVVASWCGVFTKETAAIAPLLVLLYDRTFVSGSLSAAWRRHARVHVALFASWLPLAWLVLANRGRGGSAGWDAAIPPLDYFLTQCGAIVHYLRLAVWPAGQVFDYGVTTVTSAAAVAGPLVFLLALGAATLWALMRNRPVGFAGACFFLLLAPSSSFVPVATQTVAEHRMYLPLAAVLAAAALMSRTWLQATRARATAAIAIAAAVAVTLGVTTFVRNQTYRTEETLWRDTVAKRPDNPRARNNLGRALAEAGRIDDAMTEYRAAIALQPNHAFAHFNLGTLLLAQGRPLEAVDHFRAALSSDPDYVSARVNLGEALTQLGRSDEAVAEFRAALTTDPGAQDARTNLAALLLDAGNTAEAESLLGQAIAADPSIAEAHYHLARAKERRGDATAAERDYREAARLKPAWAPPRLALGNLLARRGETAAALSALREAVTLDPRSAEAHYGLGNLLAKTRDFRAAMNEYRATLELAPAHVEARVNLANCQLVTGAVRDAVASYEQALQLRPGDETVRRNLELARELLRGGAP